jgi:3-oxoacyl-[acyl-carrier protein] reductase
MFLYKPFLQTSIQEWHDVINSSLMSAVLCCRRALPAMRTRGAGNIVNVAVMHADRFRPRPHTLPYAIAKSGIIHLTKTLAKTEGTYGIRVNAVCPGFVGGGDYTSSNDAKKVPLGRLARPDDVAKAVGFLASEDAGYVTGTTLDIHGGALL